MLHAKKVNHDRSKTEKVTVFNHVIGSLLFNC